MKANAVMREVFETMKARPVYHYFEGLLWTVLGPFDI